MTSTAVIREALRQMAETATDFVKIMLPEEGDATIDGNVIGELRVLSAALETSLDTLNQFMLDRTVQVRNRTTRPGSKLSVMKPACSWPHAGGRALRST